MSYTIKVLNKDAYLELGIEDFKTAQEVAIHKSNILQEEVIIINDDDDNVLCVTQIDRGYVVLCLCRSGLKDSPSLAF